jgi:hypothetical protein
LLCAAALAACGRGTANRGSSSAQSPISISGCIVESGGSYVLVPNRPGGEVGTTGSEPTRYRLIDEAHVGVDRVAGRQAQITGKLEPPREEAAAPTDRVAETRTSPLPAIRVAQMTTGGECGTR